MNVLTAETAKLREKREMGIVLCMKGTIGWLIGFVCMRICVCRMNKRGGV